MRCYFLRHGIAADREEWRGPDADRPLTDDGRKRMIREAKTMAALELGLDVIVTSPLVRAKQTAAIVAAKLDLRDRLVEDGDAGLDFDRGRLARILKKHPSADAVMLVGHEPSMSETLGDLIGGARIDFKKGSLACVDLDEPSSLHGVLLWVLPPKVLTVRRR